MITDDETNFLFVADTLQKRYSAFYHSLKSILIDCKINFDLLPNTKDIWAVDYMPIQIDKNNFVQFIYNPDYLRYAANWRRTISNVDAICQAINISPVNTNILLDGGNVIKAKDKVILCDKVFLENPSVKEKDLIKQLQTLFHVDKIIFIPTMKNDIYGHADGMIRFYDENTVLINDFSKEDLEFQLRFRIALDNAGLTYIEIPYNLDGNANDDLANGCYINYLRMKDAVIIPTFDLIEDDIVIKQFEQLFTGKTIKTINSNEIADEGGVLNCITWNILLETT
jgi:agmatine deiminase